MTRHLSQSTLTKYLQAASDNVDIDKTSASYNKNNRESEETLTQHLSHSGVNDIGERLSSNIHTFDEIPPSYFRKC
jgi:hypothetical protein